MPTDLVALVLFSMAKTIFILVLAGIALLVLARWLLKGKDPTPGEWAADIERLLTGQAHGWDVDEYEHLYPRDPQLREMWKRSLALGGLPEDWVRLDGAKKDALREIIRSLRDLDNARRPGNRATGEFR